IFYSIAILMILTAILTINLKNIFHSLLSAICVFFLAGIIFYILGSEYNAIIQIAIYGVAIPIILGMAVMFTDFRNSKKNLSEQTNLKYLVLLISGIFILVFFSKLIAVPFCIGRMQCPYTKCWEAIPL
ncbi:MAG: NADH-quinone oxidoreductase subunit J, partial [Bacteroides sp.]|nr:NADH-quinone oxidoreductase subunit J [Bacteroides sp.]